MKCRKVSRTWRNYLDNHKILQIRVIKATVEPVHDIGDAWIRVFDTATTKTIMDLGKAIGKFYGKPNLTYHKGLTPLHVAAGVGNSFLFKNIYKKANDKFPRDTEGWTFLHYPAQNDHSNIFEYILEKLDDENPEDKDGCTPLLLAAERGHSKVFQYIIKFIKEVNPKFQQDRTPLHMAASFGQLEICKLIMEKIDNGKN